MIVKYTRHGQEVKLVSTLPENAGFVVQRIFLEGDDQFLGEQIVLDAIFDQPPVDKFHPKVEALNKEIGDLSKKRLDLQHEIHDLSTELKTTSVKIDEAKKYGFDLFLDVVQGKSFFATHTDGTITKYPDDYKDKEESRDNIFRAISLSRVVDNTGFYRKKMELKVHSYSDMSGNSSQTVTFHRTIEEAENQAKINILEKMADPDFVKTYYASSYIKRALDFGLADNTVVKMNVKKYDEIVEKNRKEEIIKLKEEIATLKGKK